MNKVIYIDTRPGKGMFAAAEGEPDYTAWVTNKYKKQQYKDGLKICFFGLTQRLHKILQQNKKPNIIIIGANGNKLKQFIIIIASQIGKKIDIEVING